MLTRDAYHRLVNGKRLAWIVPALGLLGSQAGHLLAYQVRSNGEARLIRVWAVSAVTTGRSAEQEKTGEVRRNPVDALRRVE